MLLAVGRAPNARSGCMPCCSGHSTQANTTKKLFICLNKTCKRQGSTQVAQFAEDLGLEELEVTRTGCQGECGNGPNICILPEDIHVNHITTPAKLRQLLDDVCGLRIPDSMLKATELRLAGVSEARNGDLEAAAGLFTQALEQDPSRGRHLIHANRSATRRGLGDFPGALEDADLAVQHAPAGLSTPFVRQAEALSALEDYRAADEALDKAAAADRDFRMSKDYSVAKKEVKSLLGRSKPFRRH